MNSVAVQIDRLAELEEIIERGTVTFVEVGNALIEIRDSKLYLRSHHSMGAYVRERWGFGRQYAYKLMDAARIAKVSPTGDIPNERQARERIRELRTQGFSRAKIAETLGEPIGKVQYTIRDMETPETVIGLDGRRGGTGRAGGARTPKLVPPPLAASREWSGLTGLIESIERFATEYDGIETMVGAVPARRRRTTAERLRRAGSYLARLAYALEAEGEN